MVGRRSISNLFVLGAGLHQYTGVQAALGLGLEVVTVDPRLSAPAHTISSKQVVEDVITFARNLRSTDSKNRVRLCTFASDYGNRAIQSLDPGDQLGTVDSKIGMRKLQRELGLPHPRFMEIRDPADIRKKGKPTWFEESIIKPNQAAGSVGVTHARPDDDRTTSMAIVEAAKLSADSRVILEERLEGIELGGMIFLENGNITSFFMTRKIRAGFSTIGHSVVSESEIGLNSEGITSQLLAIATTLGYSNGPINFDAILDKSGPILLEFAFRTGGNGLSQLMKLSTGFDPERRLLQLLCGVRDGPSSQNLELIDPKIEFANVKHSSILLRARASRMAHDFQRGLHEIPGVSIRKVVAPRIPVRPWSKASDEFGYIVFDHFSELRDTWPEFKEIPSLKLSLRFGDEDFQ